MKTLNIIYWSGTGNTEMMAEGIKKGAETKGVKVNLVRAEEAEINHVTEADLVAFGCPSMGAEVLEEAAMEPFIDSLNGNNINKPTVLFGSYDWGDGEWMRNWEERMSEYGSNIIGEPLILQNTPDDDGLSECEALGAKLASC